MLRSFAALLAALALAGSVSTAALAKNGHGHGNSMNAPGHMKRACAPGQHWVKPYRKRNGTWVEGYCR
jgi:hypothetical protein